MSHSLFPDSISLGVVLVSKFSGQFQIYLDTWKIIVKIMNSLNIEVISPDFICCGIPYFTRGDLKSFNQSIKKYLDQVKKYGIIKIYYTILFSIDYAPYETGKLLFFFLMRTAECATLS